MTDAELVRQARDGQPTAYEQLVRRWSARVLAVCHARVPRRDVAEELAQEALLRGYESLSSLEAPEKFGAWLRGIAARVCLDWLKARQAQLQAREVDDILRTVDHLNLTTQWAQSRASDAQLEAVTDTLLLAMHDLRSMLVKRKAERLGKAE